MADQGHKLTDEALEALEKRLYDEYEQAAKETQEKLDKYMKKFATKDAIWKKSVEAGLKTQEEYDKWRLQAIAAGDRWEKMKDRIVADQLHVNQIAREIMDNEMPSIFELNANFALYQVEHDAQIDTSLTLYNREAVGQILRDDPDLLLPPGRRVSQQIQEGKAQRWERQKVQSVMTQGILQGESIPKLASRLASAVADSDYKAAVRNARTMATNAQNAGRYDAYNRLTNNGVELTLEWAATLDNRTRHEHRMMHGQRRNVGEPFEVSGVKIMYPAQTGSFMSIENAPQELIWNCFTGDNAVETDSQIVKSYKHEYSGELITIETASGVHFTCTPNHPILTRFGWIPAASLHKGDDLLVTSTVNDGSIRRDGDVDHIHASFEALHESLSNLGRVDQRPMTDFNFHGDVPTSDVEVVSQERLLRGCIDTGISQGFYESVLKNADPLVFSKRHLVACFRRVYISTLRFMSRSRKALSLLWRGIGHANVHGLGAVADRDVILPEYAINDLPAETIIRSQLLDGLAGRVFVDNIISVHKRSSTCHVYNLQTENGYYFVGSSINQNGEKGNGNYIIAKNCRCTILAFVKGYEHDTIKHSDKMGKMTFEEWLEAKPKPQNILHQKNLGDKFEEDYIKQYRKMSKEADEILAGRNTVVDGKDLVDTWQRRPDKFDFEIDDVLNAQGFDGKPRVVSQAEFDELVKAANGGQGFIAQRTYSAPDEATVREYQKQLYKGKWYVDCSTGGAAYGQGMYCVADFKGNLTDALKSEVNGYKTWGESRGNKVHVTETFTVTKDAKVIKYEELQRKKLEEQMRYASQQDMAGFSKIASMDIGAYGALKGYDVVVGANGRHTVILNRTKVVFLDQNASVNPVVKKQSFKPVSGKDISTTWKRRKDKFDFEIEDVINAQGFDGKPRVVSKAVFDEAVKNANFIAQRAYSAPDQETLDAYRDQLYNGKWYVDCSTGGARHGQGMYCIADYNGNITGDMRSEASSYAGYYGNRPSYIETFTVDPSAKFIEEATIREKMNAYNEGLRSNAYRDAIAETTRPESVTSMIDKYKKYFGVTMTPDDMADYMKGMQLKNMESDDFTSSVKKQTNQIIKKYKLKDHSLVQSAYRNTDAYKNASSKEFSDVGSFAAAAGWDGIKVSGREGQAPYAVILNRTKVIFLKED